MSELARVTSASLSRLSHTASRLERKGYVLRERLPGAGRRTVARLTPTGVRALESAAPAHVALVRTLMMDVVSPDDLAALTRVGHAVVSQIDPDFTCPE